MKNLKSTLISDERLLQARKINLENQAVGSLRSHGKLWGMDVFSWYKPNLNELENTLASFPSPVFWFGNESEILALLHKETNWTGNIKLLCSHDRAGFVLPNEVLDRIDLVLGSASLDDALEILKSLKQNQAILLFTASNENWSLAKESFEGYLDRHQHSKN